MQHSLPKLKIVNWLSLLKHKKNNNNKQDIIKMINKFNYKKNTTFKTEKLFYLKKT